MRQCDCVADGSSYCDAYSEWKHGQCQRELECECCEQRQVSFVEVFFGFWVCGKLWHADWLFHRYCSVVWCSRCQCRQARDGRIWSDGYAVWHALIRI